MDLSFSLHRFPTKGTAKTSTVISTGLLLCGFRAKEHAFLHSFTYRNSSNFFQPFRKLLHRLFANFLSNLFYIHHFNRPVFLLHLSKSNSLSTDLSTRSNCTLTLIIRMISSIIERDILLFGRISISIERITSSTFLEERKKTEKNPRNSKNRNGASFLIIATAIF